MNIPKVLSSEEVYKGKIISIRKTAIRELQEETDTTAKDIRTGKLADAKTVIGILLAFESERL